MVSVDGRPVCAYQVGNHVLALNTPSEKKVLVSRGDGLFPEEDPRPESRVIPLSKQKSYPKIGGRGNCI